MSEQTQIPRVLWAQQRETVLLTISVPDIEKVDVKFEENSVHFHGESKASNSKNRNVYAVKIDLYGKIDPEACKYENVGQKYWRLLLKKKDSTTSFWPRLTKDKARLHWLQTDFDHWKDENESDDEKPGFDGNFQDMFSGGMGGMDDMPDMGDGSDEEEEDDSDDEEATPTSTKSGANVEDTQKSKTSNNEQ
ncbi:unnamed protein product [Adineta steineri]|uniref:CS domain-containing protein n=1 Tax=Adineta steineri TaxID=433720 RepID=A0A815T9B2_9BILA|nr:unnamed protein product [Adineta steineri]CAF1498949.1 unnamed protein product [Adineta steineri]CAF3484567.1 unnamed protein product [Adineta steineri]CAF3522267.1 unnamed protein product [Adineta steineri]